jgi:hypothetical protein
MAYNFIPMPTRSAGRALSLSVALSRAEELVSAPGNNTTVVWIEPGRGGVVLRQAGAPTIKGGDSPQR